MLQRDVPKKSAEIVRLRRASVLIEMRQTP